MRLFLSTSVLVIVSCKDPVPPPTVIADDIKVDVTAACTTITAIVQEAATHPEMSPAGLGLLRVERCG